MGCEFIGGDLIRAKLQALLDAKPQALHAAGVSLLTAAYQSIQNSGPGWKPFSRPPRRAHDLLRLTGLLLKSLAFGQENNIFEESENQIVLGSNVKYAAAQNLGVPSHDLPARPFLFISQSRIDAARDAYMQQLTAAWNRA